VQARCLECGGLGPATGSLEDQTLFDAIAARLGL
jgi:protease-4